jgi:hypothetical protein
MLRIEIRSKMAFPLNLLSRINVSAVTCEKRKIIWYKILDYAFCVINLRYDNNNHLLPLLQYSAGYISAKDLSSYCSLHLGNALLVVGSVGFFQASQLSHIHIYHYQLNQLSPKYPAIGIFLLFQRL